MWRSFLSHKIIHKAVDDGSCRARFAFGLLAARDIECMVDAIESAVATPKYKIVMYRALRRKVLGQGAPLTTRAQDVHDPVHHLPDINRSFVAAGLGRRDHRRDGSVQNLSHFQFG